MCDPTNSQVCRFLSLVDFTELLVVRCRENFHPCSIRIVSLSNKDSNRAQVTSNYIDELVSLMVLQSGVPLSLPSETNRGCDVKN